MNEAIKTYLEEKKLAWAPTTLRAEGYRLQGVADLLGLEPAAFWAAIEKRGLGRYSLVTLWTTVTSFLEVKDPSKAQAFRAFRMKNRRAFKNAYVKRPSRFTGEEVRKRIVQIEDCESRALATFLLDSACRYAESQTYEKGFVCGKGNKTREVMNSAARAIKYSRSYSTFYRHLAAVGLKSHDLRKAHLSGMAKDLNPFELAAVAGWSSVVTAQSYIATEGARIRAVYGTVKL